VVKSERFVIVQCTQIELFRVEKSRNIIESEENSQKEKKGFSILNHSHSITVTIPSSNQSFQCDVHLNHNGSIICSHFLRSRVRGTCRELICIRKEAANEKSSSSFLSCANIISARRAYPRTQFTIMGRKLRPANHCIIGEMFALKNAFLFPLALQLNNT
jgi:hypothetical protein